MRLDSNVPAFDNKTIEIGATATDGPGWLQIANVHHFRYAENGPAHLWVGDTVPEGLDRAAFETLVRERAAAKISHLRIRAPKRIDEGAFGEFDSRLEFINGQKIVADLILTPDAADRTARQEYVRYVIARCAARNSTWVLLDQFEKYAHARELVRELAGFLREDPYRRLITVGAAVSSGPFADEKLINYRSYGSADPSVTAIEDQVFPIPAVSDFRGGENISADEFRHRLWISAATGAYPESATTDSAMVKYLGVWAQFTATTRYWDMEPFFDVEGAVGISIPDIEYVLYAVNPGTITVTLERKRGWDVEWINPLTGEHIEEKKLKEDTFTGEPPDRSHDWVLHISREGHLESMLKSYRFEARPVQLQELDADPAKVPFQMGQPAAESLSFQKPASYAVKLTKESRGTRRMTYLWTGEVTADGEGYRVLGTGPSGEFRIPANIIRNFPGTLHLRLYGLNTYGKLYSIDQNFGVTQ